jgi:hypothetical protein
MKDTLVFLPIFIQLALTLWLYIYLAMAKSKASKHGLVNESRRALHDDAWPDSVLQINNCIRNQFEVPILFYIVTILIWLMGSVNIFVHVLAWIFVITRIVHATIHVTSNYVPLRRKVFMIGCLVLMAMTILLGYFIISAAFITI